jgi:homoserine dehydrogenase
MNPVRIGLLGLGTVGGGTVNVLRRNNAEITRRAGRAIHVVQACARDLNKARICSTEGIALSEDPAAVVGNPDVEVVVELIGGIEPARSLAGCPGL